MPGTALRRKLLWLIGGRAGVITLLLGSAILIQLKSPGSFPIDPFFALIGLTYALTVVWTLTLPFVDRHPWLVDVQVACDALIVSAIVHLTGGVTSYFASLYTLPIIAASTVQSWRGGLMVSVAQLADVRRPGGRAVRGAGAAAARRAPRRAAGPPRGGLHGRPQRVRLHGRRRPERLPRGRPAAHRRAARAGVDRSSRTCRRSTSTSSTA